MERITRIKNCLEQNCSGKNYPRKNYLENNYLAEICYGGKNCREKNCFDCPGKDSLKEDLSRGDNFRKGLSR